MATPDGKRGTERDPGDVICRVAFTTVYGALCFAELSRCFGPAGHGEGADPWPRPGVESALFLASLALSAAPFAVPYIVNAGPKWKRLRHFVLRVLVPLTIAPALPLGAFLQSPEWQDGDRSVARVALLTCVAAVKAGAMGVYFAALRKTFNRMTRGPSGSPPVTG